MASRKHNCGVYLIISPSGGRYVGSSKNLTKRFNRYKNLSCNNQYALISSFKKYGFENHIIKTLVYCDEKDLLFYERVFGDIYLSLADFKNGLNIRLPGYGEIKQALTEEMREKIREGCRKRWSRPEERQKTSDRAKAAMKNPLLREQLRMSALGQWDEQARKEKSTERKKYYELNPQAKVDYGNRMKQFRIDNPDVAERSRLALVEYYKNNPQARSEQKKRYFKNNANPNAIKLVNVDTGEIYDSIEQVAKLLKVTGTTVTNRMKTNQNFQFRVCQ